jgi:hypothetical protein
MTIRGRSLGEASRIFVDHINSVLHKTLTQTPLSVEIAGSIANIRFRRGTHPATAQIRTRYGIVDLYIGQLCDTILGEQNDHVLRTVSYRYALVFDGRSEPLMRWEYVRTASADDRYCRHHLQGSIELDVIDSDGRTASLQDWHLPTGSVSIEEVLRFCIVDLGVRPLDEDWHDILRDSHARFSTQLAHFDER